MLVPIYMHPRPKIMTFVQVNGSWDGPNGSQWLLLKRQKHTKLNPVPGHVVTSVELHFRY